MTREQKKQQREAVQLAWMTLISLTADAETLKNLARAANALVAAFPEYLGQAL